MSKILTPYNQQKPPLGAQLDFSHPLSKSLVGCWLMNEGGGGISNDLLGSNNLIAKTGTTWGVKQKTQGILCNSANLGFEKLANDRLKIPLPITLLASVYLLGTPTDLAEIAGVNYEPSTNPWICYDWSWENAAAGHRFVFNDGGTFRSVSTGVKTVSGFMHFVAVLKSNGIKLYVNSINVYSNTTSYTKPNYFSTSKVFAGTYTGVARNSNVIFNQMSIYNRALSPQEIQSLYVAPYQMIQQKRTYYVISAGTEETAAYAALSLLLTVPSVTSTYTAELTAAFTALSLVNTIPAIAASYVQENTAAFTPLSLILTIPDQTATIASELTAAFTPLAVTLTQPSITATYAEVDTAAFTPLSLVITQPNVTASYEGVYTAAFTPLALTLTIPDITASVASEYSASFTPVTLILTAPTMAASYAEVDLAAFVSLSLILSIPDITASVNEESTAAFTPLSLSLSQPSVTATYSEVDVAEFNALAIQFATPEMLAIFEEMDQAEFDPLSLVLTVPSITASEYPNQEIAEFDPLSLLFTIPGIAAFCFREEVNLTSTISKTLSATSGVDKTEEITGNISKSASLTSNIGEA